MAKDKDKDKETKPPQKPRMLSGSRMTQLRQMRQRPKMFHDSRTSCSQEKRGPSNDSASSSFLSPVPSILAQLLLEQDCGSTIPPLLLSHCRYHPYLLDCYQNKIVDLLFCLFFFLIAGTIHTCSIAARIRFWIYHPHELSLLQLAVTQVCLSRFVYDVPFLYLIKRTTLFTS